MKRDAVPRLVAALAGLLLSSCAVPNVARSGGETADRSSSGAPVQRPGLGTGYGESRFSSVNLTDFRRQSVRPHSVERVFYNDRTGVTAATQGRFSKRFSGWQKAADGMVSIGLKSEGGWLRGVNQNGTLYFIGEPGERYDILIRNETPRRMEVVLSVDGLDVLDGRPASVSKRGYIIPADSSIRVEGWRTSLNHVAAFRFAKVSQSYAAQKHGDTRNVGVIGVAVFPGAEPLLMATPDRFEEQHRREADPFPAGRWATPP